MQKPDKRSTPLQEKVNTALTIIVLALFIIVPPILCSLLYLSRVPDVTWEGNDSLSYSRVWMYRERRPLGLAYQSQRVISEYSDTEVCVENRLRFLLWGRSREAQPSASSQKMVRAERGWQPTGEECP
jgi:hypothetical protein